MSNPVLKILVGYHKPAYLIKNDVFVPIHLGRALATQVSKDGAMTKEDYQWMVDNMIGDDTGDNISTLNREFCELTAIYWAWKNYDKLGNPDYIGFNHYRRFLDFETDVTDSKVDNGIIYEKDFNEYLISMYEKNSGRIKAEITKFDIIHGCLINHDKTVKEQFKNLARPEFDLPTHVFDEVIRYVIDNCKDFSVAAQQYVQQKKHYWFNCFIMKKEIFMEYCEFLFSVLLKFYKTTDYSKLSIKGQRVLAYISERLLGIFITQQLIQNRNINYRPIIFIEDTSVLKILHPAFSKNNIAMFCSTDDNYAYYCGVLLKSIIEQADSKNNYDLIVLEEKLSEQNKKKIKALQNGHPNVSIRFYNVANLMNGKDFHLCAHFTIATYYRMFVASIFKNYDKIIYLDIDMIVLHDLSDLYNIDIGKNWIAGCLDYGVMAKLKSGKYETAQYFKDKIGVNDVFNEYFQAGLLVFNLSMLRTNNVENKLIETALNNNFAYVDQDVLNKVCYNHVFFLDSSWNTATNEGRKKGLMDLLPVKHFEKWQADRITPKVIHYCSYEKPWKNPGSDLAYHWWKYARQTPFYEEFLQKIFANNVTHYKFNEISKLKRKYQTHRLLSHITFGKMYKKQKIRAKHYKQMLSETKK